MATAICNLQTVAQMAHLSNSYPTGARFYSTSRGQVFHSAHPEAGLGNEKRHFSPRNTAPPPEMRCAPSPDGPRISSRCPRKSQGKGPTPSPGFLGGLLEGVQNTCQIRDSLAIVRAPLQDSRRLDPPTTGSSTCGAGECLGPSSALTQKVDLITCLTMRIPFGHHHDRGARGSRCE